MRQRWGIKRLLDTYTIENCTYNEIMTSHSTMTGASSPISYGFSDSHFGDELPIAFPCPPSSSSSQLNLRATNVVKRFALSRRRFEQSLSVTFVFNVYRKCHDSKIGAISLARCKKVTLRNLAMKFDSMSIPSSEKKSGDTCCSCDFRISVSEKWVSQTTELLRNHVCMIQILPQNGIKTSFCNSAFEIAAAELQISTEIVFHCKSP